MGSQDGKPVAPAIVWQDRRTAERCDALRAAGAEPLIQARTGLVIDAYFSGTKLEWLLDHVTDARARAERGELAFGTVDSWLIWNLTGGGEHVTDVSNASRTMLFDLARLDWDDELLALLNVPRSVLPRVVPSSGVCGETLPELFGRPLPIAGIAGDQQAATFGQACLTPGMAKNTYGTGCFVLLNIGTTPTPSQHKLVTTVGWQLASAAGPPQGSGVPPPTAKPGAKAAVDATNAATFCLEGSIFMGGATVQWLRDGLKIIKQSADVEALATSVPDTGGVALVPAFAGLGAPYWDAYARGTLVGMSRGTTGAHIARAALESIAMQSADVLDVMQQDAGAQLSELRVDGGASQNNLLMQLQADVLGVPVVRPQVTETTALGAAYLAGLGVGFWAGVDEIAQQWQVDRRFEPTLKDDERQAKLALWRRAVERSRGWLQAEV